MKTRPLLYTNTPVSWQSTNLAVPYPDGVAQMEGRVAEISVGGAKELIWCLEHPPLYTAGTSAQAVDLIEPDRFPVYKTGRGGQYTYHGPGQLVVYCMLDMKTRGRDVRAFVAGLERLIINVLSDFGVTSGTRAGRIGVWVDLPDGREAKIAALGIRVRKWVSYHGISININPDLSHFNGIIPCGIRQHGVTSLHELGVKVIRGEVEMALRQRFEAQFGPLTDDL